MDKTYMGEDGRQHPEHRKEEMPSCAYELKSDIRDIKTKLDIKLQPFDEMCRMAREAHSLALAHAKILEKLDNQTIWLQRAVWAIIIAAVAGKLLGV